jgi:hypothetical protein
MRLRPLLGGLKSALPLPARFTGTGGTTNSRYCYSVWLRHLSLLSAHDLPTRFESVVELGPGDSLGAGLAALLTTASRYTALDVLEHADPRRNLQVLDELVPMVSARERIPDDSEFPDLHPRLSDYRFPESAGRDERFCADLVTRLRSILESGNLTDGSPIRYVCPWSDPAVVAPESADYIFSQAVLQDIDEVQLTALFHAACRWLRPGGVMTHQVNLSSPESRQHWNEHWTYPAWAWRIVRGRRPYFLNRLPFSRYAGILRGAGFEVVAALPVTDERSVPVARLAAPFRSLDAEDLRTSAVFLIARKP